MEMADDRPLISVVLPFFNALYLQEAIESILDQTYPNYELILIDNGSTDDSSAIAGSYLHHPHVVLVNEPERGVVHAANRGIEVANGNLIARMDADDISSSNRLELQYEYFQRNPDLGVVPGLVKYLGPSENEGFIHYVDWINSIVSREDIYLNQFVEFPIANPSMMFKKDLVSNYGLFKEGDFPEDYEFFLRLQSHGVLMEKVDKSVLKWRDTSGRLTRNDPKYTQEAFFRIKAKYLAQWLEKNNPFHPEIYIWGGGRLSRRRSDLLFDHAIEVVKYIDVKEGMNQLHYQDIPGPDSIFIVSYVANRGARAEIRSYLIEKGFNEGRNFIIAS